MALEWPEVKWVQVKIKERNINNVAKIRSTTNLSLRQFLVSTNEHH